QAEDGIRDRNVTGVQTCALPIFYAPVLDDIGALNLFGLDLKVSEGLGGLLGAIFAAYVFTKIERFTRKHTIDSLDLIVTPLVTRSEEHTSELQSRFDLVCRLLLE